MPNGDLGVYRHEQIGRTRVEILEATIERRDFGTVTVTAIFEGGERLSLWGNDESAWMTQVAAALVVRAAPGRSR